MACGVVIITAMDSFLRYAREKQKDIITLIREFIECESPSDHAPGVNRFVDLMAARIRDIARIRTYPGGEFGKHLRCEFRLPGGKKDGQILALGHSDTVWPLGTIRSMPFRQARGRLWGPGVLDMKAGLAFFIAAGEFGRRSPERLVAGAHRRGCARKRRRVGARTRDGARRETQDGAEGRGGLRHRGPRRRLARRSRFFERSQRDRGNGAADRENCGLHAARPGHYREPGRDPRRHAQQRGGGGVPRGDRRARAA